MSRDAAVLVEQFLESGEPQVRRNAVIALAAIGTPAMIGRLVDLAAGDDGPVRDQALKELAALPGSSRDALRAALAARMAEPAREGAMYLLQGRLGAAGVELGGEPAAPLTRLRRAIAARRELRDSAGWRFGVIARAFGWAAAALVVMAALVFALAPGAGLRPDSMLPAVKRVLEVAWLLALVLGVIGSRAATPFGAYPDRAAAAAVEVGAMLLWGIAVFLAVLLSVALVALFEKNLALATAGDAGSCAVFVLSCVLFPAAVRLGTLAVGRGVEPKRWSAVLRVAVGAALGIAAISVVLALDVPQEKLPAALRGWPLMVPGAFALAWAMVLVDDSGPRLPPGARWRVAAALLVPLLTAAWFAAPLLAWARMPDPADDAWLVTSLPATRDVEVRSLRLLTVEAPHSTRQESLGRDLVAEIRSKARTIRGSDDPPHVTVAVDSGEYEARVSILNATQEEALGRPLDISDIFPLMASYLPVLGPGWREVRSTLAEEVNRAIPVAIREERADTAGLELLALSAREADDWRIGDALEHLATARRDRRVEVDPEMLYRICWRGALSKPTPGVLAACDEAIALDPDAPIYHDGRGVARALTGDRAGAIADFQAYVAAADASTDVSRHREWIASLRRGENPIDDTVLEKLRQEEEEDGDDPAAVRRRVMRDAH